MESKIEKIKNWINKGGFPFEMKVAKAFKESDFLIGQSILFKDPESEKYRETDIIAHISRKFGDVWFNLTFVVECKKTVGKPWIILKSDPPSQIQKGKLVIFGSRNAQVLIKKLEEIRTYRSPLVFPDLSNYGYNVVTAFSEKNDSSYAATQSVLKATEYLVSKSNESMVKFCNIYIPIIAVEGELYEGQLNHHSEIDVEEKHKSTFISTKSFEEKGLSLLTIVTSEEIEDYIKNLKKECDLFFENYKIELEELSLSNPTNSESFIF